MPNAVTDTHALIWYIEGHPNLSLPAKTTFEDCKTDGGRIFVPTICAVEIVYLGEKARIRSDLLQSLLAELAAPDTVLQLVDLDLPIVLASAKVPRAAVPDLPDRIIAATALAFNLPLVTRDQLIRGSGVPTIW